MQHNILGDTKVFKATSFTNFRIVLVYLLEHYCKTYLNVYRTLRNIFPINLNALCNHNLTIMELS